MSADSTVIFGPPLRLAGPVFEWSIPLAHFLGDREIEPGKLVVNKVLACLAPSGRTLELPGFVSDGTLRVRLWADEPGIWRWRRSLPISSQPPHLAEDWQEIMVEPTQAGWPKSPLRMSDNRRYLTYSDGSPFFYLGDTVWFITWKGKPEEWQVYLKARARQCFTVLQTHILPFRWDQSDVNGEYAFHDADPTQPNERYFERVDQYCQMAAERGFFVMFALMWGGPLKGHQAERFSNERAIEFTRYASARFGAFPVIWSLSGDAPYARDLHKWEEIGRALAEFDVYDHPTTNHLAPSMNWCALHHDSDWHDFHMIQTGHSRKRAADIAALPLSYYRRERPKAFLNGEPWYDAHPSRDTQEYGPTFSSFEARYAFWVSILNGATMGHSYGGQGLWNWKREGDSELEHIETPQGRLWAGGPQIGPIWSDSLELHGGESCGVGAKWLKTQAWWKLQPCPERVEVAPSTPSVFSNAACATIPDELWLIYLPNGNRDLFIKGIERRPWRLSWLDPKTGGEHIEGDLTPDETQIVLAPKPPDSGDWVLVIRAAK